MRSLLIVNNRCKSLESEVKRYIAIQYFYSRKEELAKDDPTVIRELNIYLEEQKAIIEEIIKKWRLLKSDNYFVISDNKRCRVSSERNVSVLLSEIMTKSFNKTIKINNSLLNKNNLTGAIKIARKKALTNIMNAETVEKIYDGIEFLSPEYNVLRSALSIPGISNDGTIPENSVSRLNKKTKSGKPVMDTICSLLSKNEDKHLPLTLLYETLKKEPFGLRDGYIPVLLAFALRSYQNVSLYFHGNEHSYTEDELVKALEEPENYTLYICNWNDDQTEYIESLERIFIGYLPEGDKLNRLERLFNAINSHYASISKSARTTEMYVSDVAKEYRNILSMSYKDYNKFFFTILPEINENLSELTIMLSNVKDELESVDDKQFARVFKVIKKIFNLEEKNDLKKYIERQYQNSWKAKSHKAFDYTTNSILDIFSRAKHLSENDIIYELAKSITGFELSYWSDNKINEFKDILENSINKLNNFNPQKGLVNGEMKITIESSDGNPLITQFSQDELSDTGKTMLKKMEGTIDNFGNSISYEEKISIMTQLLKEIIQ